MSTVIGTIKAIMGQVWIVASDGTRRQATEGEHVMRGEQVVTEQGAVTVTLPDGKNLDLGRASHWGDNATMTASTDSTTAQDLAAVQQAIAEGADPTQVLEATAAGNPVTSSATGEAGQGGEGHTHVVLDLTGQILDPTAGYPTDGIGVAFPEPLEEVTLLEPDQGDIDNTDDPIVTPEVPTLPEASITIDAISGDNIINMQEATQETTAVSGKTGLDVRPGDVVTVTVNGNHYQTTVKADGSWSVDVNTSDLLASGDVQASVTTRDDNGNEATATAQSSVGQATLDVDVTIDPISGDGWLNAEEAGQPTTTISGTVGGDAKAGDVVQLDVNGNQYTATVTNGPNGSLVWQTEVATSDLLADPQVNGSITITDQAGNSATATDVESVQVDTDIRVTLDIDTISEDGWINAEEAGQPTTTISGTVGGDAKAGDVVQLDVNGNQYTATVTNGPNGSLVWQTEVSTADLLADPEVNGSITITDQAGNSATATDVESVQIDTDIRVSLDIDTISDGWINAEEAEQPTTTISGTVGGDAKAGDVVQLDVNGNQYTATVTNGPNGTLVWQTEVSTADLLADPEVNGSITITDQAGNSATATDVESVQIDTDIRVTLDIDTISDDGWINAEEAGQPTTTISGTVGGDAKAGDVVQLDVNGNQYTATVTNGPNGTLVWQTEVSTADLLADPQVNGSITITDQAGNSATATDVESVQIDTDIRVTLDIDTISDGWINAEEAGQPTTTVSGTVGGDAKAGDVVQLDVNGNQYTAIVTNGPNGSLVWQTEVSTADLLADPEVNGSITITDQAGNSATATDVESVQIDTDIRVTLDIDTISDGWINAEEAEQPTTTISGTVGGDAKAGDVVQLEVNNNTYTATVTDGPNGTLVWQTEVSTADLLADPEVNGSITITDQAGNSATATDVETVQIDTDIRVTLDIDTISEDGWINAEEAEQPTTTISGTVGGDAKAGDVVQLEVNNNTYTATVTDGPNGSLVWQTEVATSDLLADPQVNGSITITDQAGNSATATDVESVQIDTDIRVTLDIDTISEDGWINAEEAGKPTTTISGTVGGDAKAGDVVQLEVNNNTYTATVTDGPNGTLVWQTEVTTSDLLADPEVNGSITITDQAGNSATATDVESVQIDTDIRVTLDIDTISEDGWINAEEAGKPTTTISGTVGGDAKAGDVVQLEVNNNTYTATVTDGPNGTLVWQTEVSTADLLADPEVNGSITIRDEAGNEATATDVETVQVDQDLPVVSLDIDTISDGWINAEEAEQPTTTISGTVGGDAKAGDVVQLDVNGNQYTATVTDGPNGTLVWQTEVATSDLLADPEVNGSITITDQAGNSATATDVESVQIDTDIRVTLDIDTISEDGWINAEEAGQPLTTISGTVGGDAKAGDVVQLEVNGNQYTATVINGPNGSLVWQTDVATSDLLADPQVNGSITITDQAGNSATATDVESVQIDTDIRVTLDIDTISEDGWINAEEAEQPTTTISGTVGGDAKAGDVVQLEVNNNTYTATVTDGPNGTLVWQTEVATSDLLADPEVNGSITITDQAGNSATATDVETVQIDTDIRVSLDIDTISEDGWINAEEAGQPTTTISGTVGGDAKAGDVVQLDVNGNQYTATVTNGPNGTLVWQTEVTTSDLLADPEVNGSITITDQAGNSATATDVETVQIDTDIRVTLDIDTISEDGWINAEEAGQPTTTISGTVGGDAKAGDVVQLEVNNNTYTATVTDGPNGTLVWQTEVATSDLLADPQVNGSITITDQAGNSATATDVESVQIDTDIRVTLDIDTISEDGWINAEEAEQPTTTISGTVGGDAKAGDVVQLEVNNNTYTATVTDGPNGTLVWQTEVSTSDLLADPQVNGSITITDQAGNSATATDVETVRVDTTISVAVTIDPVTGDDFLSFAETNKLPGQESPTIKVTGTVTGEATVNDFVDVTVGDVTHRVQLQDDGNGNLIWEADFSADNLMKNPDVSASITITDPAGNTASDSADRVVTIETGNLITGNEYDNVIEGGEGTSDLIIADTQGFQQQPGQDYNIAFIVDSSGSVGANDVKSIIASLTEVFNKLSSSAQLENSGEVKILLVDFDTQVNYSVSVNLSDPNALKTLTDALAKMTSGGGTNYEDAFKTAANWFTEVSSEGSENLTYFITDGKPTYYQTGEKTSVDVDGRNNSVVTLDMTKINYTPGDVVSMNINGTSRVVIDADGNVYSWNNSGWGGWSSSNIGNVRADGKGGYEISTRGGNGSSTDNTATTNSLSGFALLMAACGNVEAIGINKGITASDLESYDSDGNVMAGVAADELANAILGGDAVQMAGAQDTVHGNAGNDILFGDMVQFGSGTGYSSVKEYVASQLGVDASQLDVSHISQYISEHPEEFDQSQVDGGKDVLFGGEGNDIIYGGGGDDILVGGSGDDVLFGGSGDDILIGDGFDSAAELASQMGTTADKLTFDSVADYVSENAEELGALGTGNDILHGGEGSDILVGGGGDDILNGGLGDDALYGGTGNDVLTGGSGNDTLYGGAGSDTFTWLKGDDGHDVIKDFNVEQGDRIDLSDILGDHSDNLTDYLQVVQNSDGHAVIEINTDGQISSGANISITVEGCSAADINSLLASADNSSIII